MAGIGAIKSRLPQWVLVVLFLLVAFWAYKKFVR